MLGRASFEGAGAAPGAAPSSRPEAARLDAPPRAPYSRSGAAHPSEPARLAAGPRPCGETRLLFGLGAREVERGGDTDRMYRRASPAPAVLPAVPPQHGGARAARRANNVFYIPGFRISGRRRRLGASIFFLARRGIGYDQGTQCDPDEGASASQSRAVQHNAIQHKGFDDLDDDFNDDDFDNFDDDAVDGAAYVDGVL
ncbi:unnamed protein product [Prorocentrum cordatum]|uniref:Uncharacterized protein n=1 Tax=Prorocentrum cordatum TaxID=2364126 RepID=A0ABN9WC32_9DINO|nr:unnamed protein product [Polarella glacialis]